MTVSFDDRCIARIFQQHIINSYKTPEDSLMLGKEQQLRKIANITFNQLPSECVRKGTPISYPKLTQRQCLVANLKNYYGDGSIFAIYDVAQMQGIASKFCKDYVKSIQWEVLELSKELEQELLPTVDLRQGKIVKDLAVKSTEEAE